MGIISIVQNERKERKLAEAERIEIARQDSLRRAKAYQDSLEAVRATTGVHNGHEWVDLGLSVRWATCNVGASSPSDYGNYYAWGETGTKSSYTLGNSRTFRKSMDDISGNPQYDAATANWGEGWRMPMWEEFNELLNKCDWQWTTQGGHNGYKVTGPNGNSIFLPAAGLRDRTSLYKAGDYGNYWGSTSSEALRADFLYFDSGCHNVGWYERSFGRSVRPVLDKRRKRVGNDFI